MPVCGTSSWLRVETEIFFDEVRRLFNLIFNLGGNMLRCYLWKGQSEALDARGNIWGVEVVLVCTCGEVVLDDPICVFVVNSNDEAQL